MFQAVFDVGASANQAFPFPIRHQVRACAVGGRQRPYGRKRVFLIALGSPVFKEQGFSIAYRVHVPAAGFRFYALLLFGR